MNDISSFIGNMINHIMDLINYLGYFGVAAGMLLESACIPLPSEIVLTLAGNMVAKGTITLLEANLAAAVGSMVGSIIAYIVGYYGGRPFILKYGKYFFVSEKHFYKSETTFNKYGRSAVFFGRLLPIIRTFISLPAGIARMNLGRFLLYSLIGMLPWNFILIILGKQFGDQVGAIIEPIYKKFEYTVAVAIFLVILFFVVKYFRNKKVSK